LQLLNQILKDEKDQEYRQQLKERMDGVRQELDRALDLYNEVRHVMEVDQERQVELTKFLGIAENEMHHLGQELKFLKGRMESVDE
jgi:chromosome segregation ATPase